MRPFLLFRSSRSKPGTSLSPSTGRDKKASGHSSRLTVMFVKRMGKVRSFDISSGVLLGSSLFFISYIIFSLIVINKYFDERRLREDRSTRIERLEHSIEETKRNLYRSQQNLMLLEDYIYNLRAEKQNQAELPAPDKASQVNPAPAVTSQPTEKAEKESQRPLVDIRDLAIKKEGTRVTVRFSLVNEDRPERPVSGYAHVIATNKESDPPQLWTFPKVALRNGVPIDYKGGQPFKIRRFKTILGRYFLNAEAEFSSSVKVLVYNETGDLILTKELDLDRAS